MKLLSVIKEWCEKGIKFPMAYDATTKKPSITLLFPYISFFLAMTSVILLMRENTLYGTIAAIAMWVIALILYLMRRLTKAKFDLKNQSIDLENDDDENTNNPAK